MIKAFTDEYQWLSNFEPCEITYYGVTYASVEHAYMSAKSDDEEWKLYCADANIPPGKVKRKSRKIEIKESWEEIKVSIMKELLVLKYAQEPYRNLLLNTGEVYIQEGNNWRDIFWGVDLETGEGENNLGKLIMEVREELKVNVRKN